MAQPSEIGRYHGQWPERKTESQEICGSTLQWDEASGRRVRIDGKCHANGARVRTVRPWKQDTRVLVKSSLGKLRARARVVYCQTLPEGTFAVGLEFLARTDAWVTR